MEWTDSRAQQLYETAKRLYSGRNYAAALEAIRGLGNLARAGSSDASWALGAIANDYSDSDIGAEAIKQLGRVN